MRRMRLRNEEEARPRRPRPGGVCRKERGGGRMAEKGTRLPCPRSSLLAPPFFVFVLAFVFILVLFVLVFVLALVAVPWPSPSSSSSSSSPSSCPPPLSICRGRTCATCASSQGGVPTSCGIALPIPTGSGRKSKCNTANARQQPHSKRNTAKCNTYAKSILMAFSASV